MSDNIAGVIQGAATFVDQIRQSERIPEKYVLVTFSDPGLFVKSPLKYQTIILFLLHIIKDCINFI